MGTSVIENKVVNREKKKKIKFLARNKHADISADPAGRFCCTGFCVNSARASSSRLSAPLPLVWLRASVFVCSVRALACVYARVHVRACPCVSAPHLATQQPHEPKAHDTDRTDLVLLLAASYTPLL